MTIQMLRQWNGLEAGAIQTLTSGEETRLIAAGLARAWTSATEPRSLVPVMADPATGQQYAGDSPVSGAGDIARVRIVSEPTLISTLPVSVRNPLAFASVNEPVAIHVKFKRGQVPGASYLRVVDASGAVVPWQWDPARHPITDALAGTWSDGSLRAGRIWVAASLPASSEVAYSVLIGGSSWGDSFTPTVTAGTDSVPYFQSPKVRQRFDPTRGALPKSFRVANTTTDYNASQNGLYHIHQLASGVTKISYTAADMTGTVGGEIGAANFGAGVIFREWESSFSWAAETSTTVRTRLRHFCNDRVIWDCRASVSAALGSASRGQRVEMRIGDPAVSTTTPDVATNSAALAYSDGRVALYGHRYKQDEYPARTTEAHSPFSGVGSGAVTLGWVSTTSIPAGAFFSWGGFFSFGFDSAANELLRCHNPVAAVAARSSVDDLRTYVKTGLVEMARNWLPVEASDATYTYAGARVAAMLAVARAAGITSQAVEGKALFEKWCALKSVTPTSAASWHTLWNVADIGFEFIGPAHGCLNKLRLEFVRQGDATNAATITSYMHALADFCVQAETTSGGLGQMKLRGSASDNFNAEGSAMHILAESLALQADATRLACLQRIAARFCSGYELGNKLPYSLGTAGVIDESIQYMRAAYHFYGVLKAAQADRAYPCLTTRIDLRQFALEFTSPLMVLREWEWNKQHTRRGIPQSLSVLTYILLLGQSPSAGDWQFSADAIEHLLSKCQGGVLDKTMDGILDSYDGTLSAAWGGPDAANAIWHLLYELAD